MLFKKNKLNLLVFTSVIIFSCKSAEKSEKTVNSKDVQESSFSVPQFFEQDFMETYWYSSANKYSAPRNDSTNFSLPYMGKYIPETKSWGFGDAAYWNEKIKPYLDNAKAMGQKVIVDLKPGVEELSYNTHHGEVEETGGPAVKKIIEFIKTFDKHPAVLGWYVQDEPTLKFRKKASESKWDKDYVQGYHKARAAYRLIKEKQWAGSKKPVFIGFASSPEVLSSKYKSYKDSPAFLFRYAYDIAISHFYPYRNELKVLDPIAVRYQFEKFKQVSKRFGQIGKPYILTVQAFGDGPASQEGETWRLPTRKEFEIIALGVFAAVDDASAVGFYSRHQLEFTSPATPQGYTKSGPEWTSEVFDPTLKIIEKLKYALRNSTGSVPNVKNTKYGSEISKGIRAMSYHDKRDGSYYVVAYNDNPKQEIVSSWLQPRMAGGGLTPKGKFSKAKYLNINKEYKLSADKQALKLTFQGPQVKVLQFIP